MKELNKKLVLLVLAFGLSVSVAVFGAKPKKKTPDQVALDQYETIENNRPQVLEALNKEQREKLLFQVSNHKVTALYNLDQYDDGTIGFCFGRAMGAHLMARNMGLKSELIRKLFVIGDLRQGDKPEWRFHVTNLVWGKDPGEDARWYATDPIMTEPVSDGKPQALEAWVDVVKGVWDKQGELKPYGPAKFYMTSSWVIIPDVTPDPNAINEGHIIQLDFNPDKFTADLFEPLNFGKIRLFRQSEKAENEYMTPARRKHKKRFNFEHLMLKDEAGNPQEVKWKGYFTELLADLSKKDFERRLGAGPPPGTPPVQTAEIKKLYSPSFLKLK